MKLANERLLLIHGCRDATSQEMCDMAEELLALRLRCCQTCSVQEYDEYRGFTMCDVHGGSIDHLIEKRPGYHCSEWTARC